MTELDVVAPSEQEMTLRMLMRSDDNDDLCSYKHC